MPSIAPDQVGAYVAAWLRELRRRLPWSGYAGGGYNDPLSSGSGGGGGGGGGGGPHGPGVPGGSPGGTLDNPSPNPPDVNFPAPWSPEIPVRPIPPDISGEDFTPGPRVPNSPPRPAPPGPPDPRREFDATTGTRIIPTPPRAWQRPDPPPPDPREEGGGYPNPRPHGVPPGPPVPRREFDATIGVPRGGLVPWRDEGPRPPSLTDEDVGPGGGMNSGHNVPIPSIPPGYGPGVDAGGGSTAGSLTINTAGNAGGAGSGILTPVDIGGGSSLGDEGGGTTQQSNSGAKGQDMTITDAFANYEIDSWWFAERGTWTEAPAGGESFLDCTAGIAATPLALLRFMGRLSYSDVNITGTVRVAQTAQMMGLVVRGSIAGGLFSGYMLYHTLAGTTLRIVRYDADAPTEIGTVVQVLAAGDVVQFSAVAGDLNVAFNGVPVLTVPDATYTDGFCAIGVFSNINANDWAPVSIGP